MKPEIVFENDTLIAFNKPSGLLSIPDRFNPALLSLYQIVNTRFDKLWMVHRLDKDTSGLVCFAKDEATHRFLSLLFQNRQVKKYYLAIVQGNPTEQKGSIRLPIAAHPAQKGKMYIHKKGKPAHTDFEVLKYWNNYSLVRLQLHTGRTHQIRVHLKAIGHPLAVDEFYGSGTPVFLSSIKKNFRLSKNECTEQPLLNRLPLHASRLEFTSANGQEIDIEAPLPRDLKAVMQQLDKWDSRTTAEGTNRTGQNNY